MTGLEMLKQMWSLSRSAVWEWLGAACDALLETGPWVLSGFRKARAEGERLCVAPV